MDLEQYLKELFEFLSIPSVSAQSEHKKDIKRAAQFLQGKLSDLNFDAEIMQTAGHPVVYAENLSTGKNKPTVLIYGHYDVQDVGDLSEWTSNPFKPEIRSGNIYARGASDDKGNFYTWVAAIDELNKNGAKLPVNIKFLLEGEEEIASKNLHEFVSENKSLLEADFAAISDTDSLSEEQPLITFGLRGIVYYELRIKTLTKDVHSGTYGGNVLNPINILANIISKIKDDQHKILVPNTYDEVRELDAKTKKFINKLPLDEDIIVQETGANRTAGEQGFSVIERKGMRPSFDVNGIWGGYQGEGPKTIIPQSAGAKLSFRLVADQDAKEFAKGFEKYVEKIIPEGVEYEFIKMGADDPILMDLNNDFFKVAELACKKVFKSDPIYQIVGGSIPVTAIFKEILGLETLLLGYALPDDGHHSPNEKFSIAMFEKGIRTNIEFLKELVK